MVEIRILVASDDRIGDIRASVKNALPSITKALLTSETINAVIAVEVEPVKDDYVPTNYYNRKGVVVARL